MFDFSFQQPIGFLLAFIPGLINLFLVFYILLYLPANKVNRIFTVFTSCLTLWQINDSLSRICASNVEAYQWDSILSIGWIFVGPACLHFALLYSGRILRKGLWIFISLYLPAIVFMGLYHSHTRPASFRASGLWGWVNSLDGHTSDILLLNWISILVLMACWILFRYSFEMRKNQLLRTQSLLIAVGIMIPTIFGIVFQVIFPVFLGRESIPVTSTALTCFSIATVAALKNYKLFHISEALTDEAIIESLPVMILTVTRDHIITYMNSYGCSKIGVRKPDVLGQPINKIINVAQGEFGNAISGSIEAAMKGERTENQEAMISRAENDLHVLFSASPVMNNGIILGALLSMRDITKLKEEQAIRFRSESLLKEAQRLARLGSWEWDLDTNKVTWSDELYKIFEYADNSVPLTYELFLSHVVEDDRARVDSIVRESLKKRTAFEYYTYIVTLSGRRVFIRALGGILLEENGSIRRLHGTAQDITDFKEQEDMLRYQNELLEKSNAELDRFVYSVSHDLRSPLTSMLGLISLMEAETTDATTIQYLQLLTDSAERLDKFILDILDYSKNARMEIRVEPIDFDVLIRQIIDVQYLSGHNRKIDIKYTSNISHPFGTDKQRLLMVLNNLISNAIRFADDKKPHRYVEINVATTATAARLIIKDNGIGIPGQHQENVFKMFFRASVNVPGSGLGLYIVKEAIDNLQGTITLSSSEGVGTEFNIELPNLLHRT